MKRAPPKSIFFFFNDTATTEIYTLSLHDALPIFTRDHPDLEEAREAASRIVEDATRAAGIISRVRLLFKKGTPQRRSEEHTSELQSQSNLVCRLLLEKKKAIAAHTRRVQRSYSLA